MKKYYPYLITVSHMINDSCQSVLPALLPLFIYTYGLSLEQAGFLILANTALSSLLQPLLGYLSDKINQPRLIALGVLLSACSTGVMGFVTSYESLLVCATLAGVGSSIFHPEGAKIMNRLGGGKKGKAMGTFAIGGSSGFAIGPLFAGSIAYTVGPHGLAAFTVVGLIISTIFIHPHASHSSSCMHYRPSGIYRKPYTCSQTAQKLLEILWQLVYYHPKPIGKLPRYQCIYSYLLDS